MIILPVAMGRGWLKETGNEISTAPVFAKSQGVRMTINTEGRIFGPGMPDNSSDMSIGERTSKAGAASLA